MRSAIRYAASLGSRSMGRDDRPRDVERRRALALAMGTWLLGAAWAAPAWSDDVVVMEVDARQAPRRIFHTRLAIPVSSGPLTLYYPKWIPGEHGPAGPVNDLTGLKITAAGGANIPWRRDLGDMYAFRCDVPAGVQQVDVELDYVAPGGEGFGASASSTARLAVVDWHLMLLYPKGKPVAQQKFVARLKYPPTWEFGGALPVARQSPAAVEFEPVSLERLIDTPILIGAHFRSLDLSPDQQPPHRLDIVADSARALEIGPERLEQYRRLVAETGALLDGARHYERYHFLLTLSDHVGHFGLEHHECSDNRAPERYLIDDDHLRLGDDLLPHEIFHSWNGKHRRPADLTAPDYQKTLRTDLLWVYEGLTMYYGEVLAARSGLFTPENYRDHLASIVVQLQAPGRTWRPLRDTADAAQVLFNASSRWRGWRRDVDFYEEGELIWLEADVIIRQQSGGARSLDDFCRLFCGGPSRPRSVVTYTYDDVIGTLHAVQPYDWDTFFQRRLNATEPQPPLAGIEQAGWVVTLTSEPNPLMRATDAVRERNDFRASLGFVLDSNGAVTDCLPESPAYQAGLAAGMKIIAVNGRKWNRQRLDDALKAAKEEEEPRGSAGRDAPGLAERPGAIELLIESDEFYQTLRVEYRGGPRWPHLKRDPTRPDLLSQIIAPLSGDNPGADAR
jgi:predicted metalloprotease with PDZ domain